MLGSILFYVLIFFFGSIIGSFLNVVIYRLPEKKSLVKERSFCPNCKKTIKWYDLFPIISFIILRGKCRNCGQKISWQYPVVEFLAGALFVFFAWKYGLILDFANVYFYRDIVISSALLVIFMTDLRYYLIFDAVTIPMIVFSLVINLFLRSNSTTVWQVLSNLLIGAAVAGGFFLLQFLISKGKWIGGGDIRLGVLMGVILGWPEVLIALVMAYIGGAVISVSLMIFKKKDMKSEMPFGVFLSLATFASMLWGTDILRWYLGLILK